MKMSVVSVIAFAMLALAAVGCGHGEQLRQAREHEQFLKDSLGTIAPDAPVQARLHGPDSHAVD